MFRCKEQISQYRRDVNPARVFLQDNYVAGFEYDGLPCAEVYQAYVRWCKSYGYRPLNNTNFGKEVIRTLRGVSRQQKRFGPRRLWVYSGLTMQEGSEVTAESFEVCH